MGTIIMMEVVAAVLDAIMTEGFWMGLSFEGYVVTGLLVIKRLQRFGQGQWHMQVEFSPSRSSSNLVGSCEVHSSWASWILQTCFYLVTRAPCSCQELSFCNMEWLPLVLCQSGMDMCHLARRSIHLRDYQTARKASLVAVVYLWNHGQPAP